MMIGSLIKQIRLNKNICPIDVYSDIISRSNYWKLEDEKISPSFETVIEILESLFHLEGYR